LKPKVADLLKYATVLNGHLACRTYVAGGRLTIADFQMASMASDWRNAASGVSKHCGMTWPANAHSSVGTPVAFQCSISVAWQARK
jgi:glutathione S-transferase